VPISNRVMLVVGGRAFEGWQTMHVQRSIEQIAGVFALQVTLKWAAKGDPFEIREGLPCQVLIGQDVVITGRIEEYEPSYDAENSTITIHGRDKTGDLVDCSVIYKTGQWHNVGLKQIVEDICKPFGIAVVAPKDLDLGDPFKSFSLEEGEKAFDAIDRACRMRGVLCTSTPAGELLLTLTSDESSNVQLIEGMNIKSASAKHSWKERYSKVILKGQTSGDDNASGATVAHVRAEAEDEEINCYRPLVVISEHGAGLATLKERAQWEVKVRMGRGKRGHIDVVGWRTAGNGMAGPLWTPNQLVYINSPRLQLDREMLIVGCDYKISDKDGRTTTLTFCRPEAFEVIAGIKPGKLSGKINHHTLREKHKRGRKNYTGSFEIDAPALEGN
jgi:prophage tail gpP-like protein